MLQMLMLATLAILGIVGLSILAPLLWYRPKPRPQLFPVEPREFAYAPATTRNLGSAPGIVTHSREGEWSFIQTTTYSKPRRRVRHGFDRAAGKRGRQ